MIQVQIPAGIQKHSDQISCPLSLLFNGYQGTYPRVQQSEYELDHLPPSSAKVNNDWSYTFTPPVCLQSVVRDNLNFLLLMAMVVNKPQCVENGFSRPNLITRRLHVKFMKWKWSSFCSKFPLLFLLIIIPYCSILIYQ